MDELEFRKRIYENPREVEQDVLDAARANPDYQKILDETVELEDALGSLLNSTELPNGLAAKLMTIPATDNGLAKLMAIPATDAVDSTHGNTVSIASNVSHINSKKQIFFQYYAIAASLVLALGVTFSLTLDSLSLDNGPSPTDIAFGEDLLYHLHYDLEEIDGISNGENYAVLDLAEVNVSMANTGTRLVSHNPNESFDVRSAKPCEIIPAYDSAHLVVEGSKGAVSIIVINNSPVDVEFVIRDDRFNGIVMPMGKGNIILVGEQGEDLDQYKSMFTSNVEWLI